MGREDITAAPEEALRKSFSDRLIEWFEEHGRKDLPWQQNRTPYRVWVSEIMLQQTQVATVIPYYERFMQHFPDVQTLAQANTDEVLHYWSGLGYYARARNMHKTARIVDEQFDGEFPTTMEALEDLPGIGRSTAAAILSLACGQQQTILDGNVKRVLARHEIIEGWPGTGAVAQQLWELAEHYTPRQRCADYNQAIMDLGATLCTRRNPHCEQCPLRNDCMALACGMQHQLPTPKPKTNLPEHHTVMLIIQSEHGLLLEKRPPSGVWGGLWSLPEVNFSDDKEITEYCQQRWGLQVKDNDDMPGWQHTFSHYRLHVTPKALETHPLTTQIMDDDRYIWYNDSLIDKRGLAAPVKRLLKKNADKLKDVL